MDGFAGDLTATEAGFAGAVVDFGTDGTGVAAVAVGVRVAVGVGARA